mgnify:CR=1 FL=1
MRTYRIENQTHPLTSPLLVARCETFFSQLRGLMFRRELDPQSGLLFVEGNNSRINSSIHMFFMNFDIAVIWADTNKKVVDVQLARRWPPFYFPAQPAAYILELHTSRLNDFSIGDQLAFKND